MVRKLNANMSSTNETIEEVDENNNPIGVILKSDAHRDGKWHRVVHIYYIKPAKDSFDFLVHLRAKDKDSSPNRWDTRFGGHIEYTQSIEDAVKAEMNQEIGVKIEIDDLIEGSVRRSVSQSKKNREFNYVFFYKGDKDESKLTFNDAEVQEVRWMSQEEVEDSMLQEPDMWAGNLNEFSSICEELEKLA
jgi:isopentenyldiphosphate isomerase